MMDVSVTMSQVPGRPNQKTHGLILRCCSLARLTAGTNLPAVSHLKTTQVSSDVSPAIGRCVAEMGSYKIEFIGLSYTRSGPKKGHRSNNRIGVWPTCPQTKASILIGVLSYFETFIRSVLRWV
jgi:hypothetical protein